VPPKMQAKAIKEITSALTFHPPFLI